METRQLWSRGCMFYNEGSCRGMIDIAVSVRGTCPTFSSRVSACNFFAYLRITFSVMFIITPYTYLSGLSCCLSYFLLYMGNWVLILHIPTYHLPVVRCMTLPFRRKIHIRRSFSCLQKQRPVSPDPSRADPNPGPVRPGALLSRAAPG